LSTPLVHGVQGSPLRVPQQPCCRTAPLDAPHMPPPTCRSPCARGRADRSDPHISRTRKRRGKKRATHSSSRLVSAESELGTLPVSAFELRVLHTRSRLGGTSPHPQHRMCPYGTRARYPWDAVPLECSVVTSRARVPSESSATALLPHRPARCIRHVAPPTCRALGAEPDRSDPPRPHAQTLWQEAGHAHCCKIGERGERARQTSRQRIVVEAPAHPKPTRPLGRYYAAPTASNVPLPYPRTVPIRRGAP
jgi:hypothetical protein